MVLLCQTQHAQRSYDSTCLFTQGGVFRSNQFGLVLACFDPYWPIDQFIRSPQSWLMGAIMELFWALRFGVFESSNNSLRECRSCNKKMRLIRLVHYAETEATMRVFECDCGERTWDE